MRGPKTVESITGKLRKTIDELESHADEQLQRADYQQALAAQAQVAHETHKREHQLALTVAGNIKALLS